MKFIKTSEQYTEIGEITDCFYSYFLLGGKLFSVHRRCKLFSFDNWPKKESENFSQIILTLYSDQNPSIKESEEIICNGNDPRVVSDTKKAFVLSQGAVHSGVLYTLTLLPEQKSIEVKLGYGATWGKNWQPIIINDELFIIDSISPFFLNKLNTETGVITKISETSVDFTLEASHDNYPILRGGSNGIVKNDIIYGWGHATTRPYSHIPFIWEYNGESVITSFVNIHSFFKEKGYNIVDPASFFEWDAEYFALSLSCSQRDWFHAQWFLNVLVLIKKEEFFQKRLPPITGEITKRPSLFFHATELDSLIDSRYINGGRYNNRKKGCLVCGPSKKIHIDKKWTVELTYSSTNLPGKKVGVFDILLTINGIEKQVAKTKVYGTKGESSKIRLSFEELSGHNEALIQTRFFASRWTSVTVYFFELIYGGE